ncbi:MAG: hypothetical protein K2L82_00090 [Lachnospiraceae bacterium]|nr:hypothetical protein [Lachnospiraceae bacterium]
MKIEDYLSNAMHTSVNIRYEKMQETIGLCIAQMHRQESECEERIGFWTYLSDIFRFEGLSIWGLQAAALVASSLGIILFKQVPEALPMFMPLFGLALVPILCRSRVCGMCEMEAATRASGAEIALAKLILAGASQLLCMTVLLWLKISVSGNSDQIVQMILYVLVPFLVCVVWLLRNIRMCRTRSMTLYTSLSFVSCAAWGVSAKVFPWLYETSATGLWIAGFVVFAVFFIREIGFIIQMRKEGKMYGAIS